MEPNTGEGQANPRASAVFGQDLDDLHRRFLKELVHGTSGPAVHFLMKLLSQGRILHCFKRSKYKCVCAAERKIDLGIIPLSNSHSTKAARVGPYTIRGNK